MSLSYEEVKLMIVEALKSEPKGSALLAISKKIGMPPVEVRRALEPLLEEGVVEKRGNTYRLNPSYLRVLLKRH